MRKRLKKLSSTLKNKLLYFQIVIFKKAHIDYLIIFPFPKKHRDLMDMLNTLLQHKLIENRLISKTLFFSLDFIQFNSSCRKLSYSFMRRLVDNG